MTPEELAAIRERDANDTPDSNGWLRVDRRALLAHIDAITEGDAIGRAMHEASQVGGPWTPCPVLYHQWPECEHEPMGRHVALLLQGAPRVIAADLRGLAPDLTGGKPAEEWVRGLRDAAE